MASSVEHPDTQIIKKAIALRAKWRANLAIAGPTFKTVPPTLIVPHPSNRCVTILRTKQLVGTIVQHARDVAEATGQKYCVYYAERLHNERCAHIHTAEQQQRRCSA